MRLRTLILIYILAAFSTVEAQKEKFTFLSSVDANVKDFQTDRLGNLYVTTFGNQLYKYSSEGKLLSTLNYQYTGNITMVDASNPLEVFVFYKELNTVLLLDNNLAFRGAIKLSDWGVEQAACIGRTYSSGLWVFDIGDMQLKKFEHDGQLLQVSGNALQFMAKSALNPNYILDNGQRVYLNDSTEGILVFDVFANYQKTIPLKGLIDFKEATGELYYLQDSSLCTYQIKTLVRTSTPLPDQIHATKFSIEKGRLYLKSAKGINIYSINY